jgi:hypothetical protein
MRKDGGREAETKKEGVEERRRKKRVRVNEQPMRSSYQ